MPGRCLGCKNGVTDKAVLCSHPDQVYERACQDALFSPSLNGKRCYLLDLCVFCLCISHVPTDISRYLEKSEANRESIPP